MRVGSRFYRFCAAASFLSVLTTLALILLPRMYGAPQDLAERAALLDSPYYILRAWVYLLHPFAVGLGAVGAGLLVARESVGSALLGAIGFLVWGLTEAGQQTLTLVGLHGWLREYAGGTPEVRDAIAVQIATYDGIWASMFLLLLIGFLVGNASFGFGLAGSRGLSRIVGWFYLAVACLTALNVSRRLGGLGLPPMLQPWLYPLVQPMARFAIGVWLLRMGGRLDAPGDV